MTERVQPSPWGRWLRPTGADGRGAPPERADFSSFCPKFHVLGRKSQTIKQNAQKGGTKFGGGAFDCSREGDDKKLFLKFSRISAGKMRYAATNETGSYILFDMGTIPKKY